MNRSDHPLHGLWVFVVAGALAALMGGCADAPTAPPLEGAGGDQAPVASTADPAAELRELDPTSGDPDLSDGGKSRPADSNVHRAKHGKVGW